MLNQKYLLITIKYKNLATADNSPRKMPNYKDFSKATTFSNIGG